MEVSRGVYETTEVALSLEIMGVGATGLKSPRAAIIKGRGASSVRAAVQISITSPLAALFFSGEAAP